MSLLWNVLSDPRLQRVHGLCYHALLLTGPGLISSLAATVGIPLSETVKIVQTLVDTGYFSELSDDRIGVKISLSKYDPSNPQDSIAARSAGSLKPEWLKNTHARTRSGSGSSSEPSAPRVLTADRQNFMWFNRISDQDPDPERDPTRTRTGIARAHHAGANGRSRNGSDGVPLPVPWGDLPQAENVSSATSEAASTTVKRRVTDDTAAEAFKTDSSSGQWTPLGLLGLFKSRWFDEYKVKQYSPNLRADLRMIEQTAATLGADHTRWLIEALFDEQGAWISYKSIEWVHKPEKYQRLLAIAKKLREGQTGKSEWTAGRKAVLHDPLARGK